MNWKTWQLVPIWAATCLGTILLSQEMAKRFLGITFRVPGFE